MARFKPGQANEEYESLLHYAELRVREISGMVRPYIQVTDRYGRLIARLTLLLGRIKPSGTQDVTLRDLMADVFDCLYEARILILSGNCSVAYPIARRAYECISLLHLCALNAEWAERWERGAKITNADIRRELAKHPMGEAEAQTKKLYNFFCLATHPNRDLVRYRLLGQGNLFVLGAIGKPDLVMVTDYMVKHLEMWFWLTATVSHFYRAQIDREDRSYYHAYMEAYEQAKTVWRELVENFNRLLHEAQAEHEEGGSSGNGIV